MSERFFIGCDNDCHNYIVPLSKYYEWLEWTEMPEDDESGWEAPEWATPIDSPNRISFENWKEE